MVVDKIKKIFLERIIIPRAFIIDKAGFVILKYSHGGYDVFMRELIMSEDFFVELEKRLCETKDGKQLLYNIGKDFGWHFARDSYFYHGEGSENDLIKHVRDTILFFNTMYASVMDPKIISEELIELHLKGMVICRKNGLGYLMTHGAWTGCYAYLANNPKIEGTQIKCQGSGDDHCVLICAEPEFIKQKYPDAEILTAEITEVKKDDQQYKEMNKIRPIDEKLDSLNDMVDIGLFGYHGGLLEHKEHRSERYFPVDCSLIHLLECRAKSFGNAEQILFDVAFNFGYRITKDVKIRDPQLYIRNYFASLGWGDIKVFKDNSKYSVVADYVPWSEFLTNYDFPVLRGLVSGLVSGLSRKRILFNETSYSILEGFLSVRFY